jgi:3',5'-cyclic AMP phosphodiesterase CpdA
MSQEAATTNAVKLVHISDIHFGAANPAALDAVREYVAQVRPDAVLVAGDITQNGRQREFRAARSWFESLGVPCIVAPGNHSSSPAASPAQALFLAIRILQATHGRV